MSGTRDFNNIETRAVIKFLFLQGKAQKKIHAILTETFACFLPCRAKDLSASLRNFFRGSTAPIGHRPPYCWGFKITLRHTTLGGTPLQEWSARRRNLHLTTNNTHKRQLSMSSAGFEPPIPARERPQNHAFDHAITGIGWNHNTFILFAKPYDDYPVSDAIPPRCDIFALLVCYAQQIGSITVIFSLSFMGC